MEKGRTHARTFQTRRRLQRCTAMSTSRRTKNCWMVKQEPSAYSWSDFVRDGKTAWTGVRNFQARNNLKAMRKRDQVLFYHSVSGKEVVGVAEVSCEAYPDPSANGDGDWVCVEIV